MWDSVHLQYIIILHTPLPSEGSLTAVLCTVSGRLSMYRQCEIVHRFYGVAYVPSLWDCVPSLRGRVCTVPVTLCTVSTGSRMYRLVDCLASLRSRMNRSWECVLFLWGCLCTAPVGSCALPTRSCTAPVGCVPSQWGCICTAPVGL